MKQVSNTKTVQKELKTIKVGELIMGTRVPYEYFITQGSGESDLGYHPGAYDVALENAGGVQNYNHIVYSSILPKDAIRVPMPPSDYDHGAVMESITAEAGKGQEYPKRLTAGLVIAKVFRKGEYLGGLVAEYNGNNSKEDARKFLKNNMIGMLKRRYSEEEITTKEEYFIESIEPTLKHACAMVVLGFISHKIPLLSRE